MMFLIFLLPSANFQGFVDLWFSGLLLLHYEISAKPQIYSLYGLFSLTHIPSVFQEQSGEKQHSVSLILGACPSHCFVTNKLSVFSSKSQLFFFLGFYLQ